MEHAEECLTLFFTQLSQLCFDKARELVEKERDAARAGPFRLLLSQLPNLVVAERSYVELGFLSAKNKIFLRKDNSLKSMYDSLRQDLHRLEETCAGDRGVASVASQICQFLIARTQLIDLYEKMYATGASNRHVKCEELLAQVEGILNSHMFSFAHPVLTSVKTALCLECEILMLLLRALIDVQCWRFLPSLMNLHSANSRIVAWEKALQNRESWKLGFGASFLKGNPLPALLQWLVKLKTLIVSKFSLYFYHTLVQQTTPQEMRNLCSKHNVDYFHKIQSIQRRCDATTVMLILDATSLTDWSGPGYCHPDRPQEPLDQFSVMVYYPIKLIEQMPTIGKAITERSAELALLDKIVCCYSLKEQSTYFMSSIDPRVTLVVVFDSKKDERETTLNRYMNELSMQLRVNRVFSYLKLNTK